MVTTVVSPAPTFCALCLRAQSLRQSHIVPKFIGAYLKDTSATGYLRDAVNPNVRQQDLKKEPLLCADCEQVFSVWEREFSQLAFPNLQSDSFTELLYDEWLLKFAVSLSWRTLVTDREKLATDLSQFAEAIGEALENWRRFLLGERKQPGSEHHLFVFAGVPEQVPDGLHPKFLHYCLRGIDATEAVSRRTVAVYVKLLRSFIYSPVIPKSPAGWKNTRIHAGQGRLINPQTIAMRGFSEFLDSRVHEVHAKPISEAQSAKIADAMMKNPERVAMSESLKVELASRRLLKQPKPDDLGSTRE
jgi:hypothetical protein